ncbi:MAG TPA: hypothetical protein PKL57_11800, partial [Candidatus Wallbacteria bacterium]|nr:hypothetical protein [Candidatus Wallbacteria bacterium]
PASTTFTITDTALPLGSFTISQPAGSLPGYFNSANINLNLTASDIVSDVTHYCIRNFLTTSAIVAPASGDSDWKTFTSSVPQQSYSSYGASHALTGGEGSKEVCVWYKDASGNISTASGSPWSIFLDTKAPKGAGSETSTVSTIASGLTVQNVAADAYGNVFVVGGGSIKKITPSGTLTTITSSLDTYISGLALDKINNLLYTCGHTSLTPIRKITMNGVVTVINGNGWGYSDGPLPSATFMIPYGCAVDNSGNLYLGDSWNNRVRKITPSGWVSTHAGTGVYGPTGNNTNQGAFADGNRLTQAMFFSPGYVTVDKDYNVFVADSFNHRIRRVDYATGNVSTYAGNGGAGYTDASPGNNATFTYPGSLTVDNFGNVFVLSCTSGYTVCAVRKIAPDTSVSTYAGSAGPGSQDGPALSATFGSLTGITSDDDGNVYVADSGNNSVRKISTPTAPPGLIINNGAKVTKTLNFKMQIFGTDRRNITPDYPSGIDSYFIKCNSSTAPPSNDSGWLSMPVPPFNNNNPDTIEVDFALPTGETDGQKIFYLWFKDKAGNVSTAAQKSIKLDRMLPVEPIAGSLSILGPNPGHQLTREVLLQLNAESGQDAGNGYYDILVTDYFINDCNKGTTPTVPTPNSSGWKTISPPRTPFSDQVPYTIIGSGDGTKEIRVWYKDIAGNMSDSSECETFLDTSTPAGGMAINSNAEWSNSPLVTLNLNATNTTGMNGYFISTSSLTPAASDVGWRTITPVTANYTANVPYSLGRSSGVKTVYVWYKSTSGIVSEVSSDTIKLDCELPEPGIELQDEWVNVGAQGFSPGQVANASLFVYNGVPYVSFEDQANSAKATVMKFDGANWVYVGSPGFTSALAYLPSISIYNDTPYVAFSFAYSPASVMKFDGTNWVYVGSQGFSGVNPGYLSFYINNGIPYVAFGSAPGSGSNKVVVMKFDGTNWVYVGTPEFSPGSSPYTSLYVYNGTPYVAYADYTSGQKISVMKFDGTSWVYVGSPLFSAGFVEFPSICVFNGTPYVAYIDVANSRKATVMAFNGTSWTTVGTPGFSSPVTDTTATAITALEMKVFNGKPFIAYSDVDKGGKISVMKFDGINWVYVGIPGFSSLPANTVSLDFYKKNIYVAYRDSAATWKATVMKYEIKRSPGL